MNAGEHTIAGFAADLAAKQPTPGGGAAAAVCAAMACATGAMACRYTTGERYPTVSVQAEACARELDEWRSQALILADADATAYAQVRAAKQAKDSARIATAEAAAAAVPGRLIALCVDAATACTTFRPLCNPWLVSDIDTAVHLLAGVGRAAWRTLLINRPSAEVTQQAQEHLSTLRGLEQS